MKKGLILVALLLAACAPPQQRGSVAAAASVLGSQVANFCPTGHHCPGKAGFDGEQTITSVDGYIQMDERYRTWTSGGAERPNSLDAEHGRRDDYNRRDHSDDYRRCAYGYDKYGRLVCVQAGF